MARERGFGLYMAILVVMVISIMSLAFVALNRQSIGLLKVSGAHLKAEQAARSAVSYARMRMASRPDWGIPSGSNRALAPLAALPAMTVYEGERDGVVTVVGVLDGGDSSFQMFFQAPGTDLKDFLAFDAESIRRAPANPAGWTTVRKGPSEVSLNNLLASGVPPLTPPRTAGRALPAGSVNLLVLSHCQTTSMVVDCTIKRAFVVDASAMSAGHLVVDLSSDGSWRVRSLDPTVNRVRAREDIVAPAPDHISFGDQPASGEAISTAEIRINGAATVSPTGVVTGVSGDSLSDNPALKASAEAAAHGVFNPNSLGNDEVPQLTPEDLRSAPGGMATLRSGRYHFVDATSVAYFDDPNADPRGTPTATYTGSIPAADGSGTAVHLVDRKFIVSGNLEVGGGLTISGQSGTRASLALGYSEDGTLAPESRGRLTAAGEVRVQGETVGQGTLLATGGGGVTLEGNSALSASPSAGVAVYSEGPVSMEPVPSWVGGVSTDSLDWQFYSQAVSSASKQTAFTYGNTDPSRDINLMGSWGNAEKKTFIGAQDATINASSEARDQVLIATQGDPNHVKLMDLAQQFDVYNNNEMVYKDFGDGRGRVPTGKGIKDLFDAAVTNYIEGKYDNFPFSDGTYPVDPGITLGRYERLKNFLVQSQHDISGADGWYYSNIRCSDAGDFEDGRIATAIDDKLGQFQSEAALSRATLEDFFSGANPYALEGQDPRDIEFKGLIYSRSNVFIKANNHRFKVQGGLVAGGGDLVIQDATGVDLIYDPSFLESVLNTMSSGDIMRHQVAFYAVR